MNNRLYFTMGVYEYHYLIRELPEEAKILLTLDKNCEYITDYFDPAGETVTRELMFTKSAMEKLMWYLDQNKKDKLFQQIKSNLQKQIDLYIESGEWFQ